MKILVTGNPNFGLAESISKIYTDAKFVTKSAGFDLTSSIKQDELSNIALDYDVFVLCSYIPDYVPNILLQKVYDNCKKNNHKILEMFNYKSSNYGPIKLSRSSENINEKII